MASIYPSVPEPTTDVASLRDAAMALKQGYELLTGNRANGSAAALTATTLNGTETILSIQSTTAGNTASIVELASTTTTADSALASTLTTLTATVNSNYSNVASTFANEATVRATADTAIAANVTTLTSTVGSHTSQLTAIQSTGIAGDGSVSANYGVVMSIDHTTGGFMMSGIKNLATGAVSYNFELMGNLIVTGSITSGGLAVNAVTIPASNYSGATVTGTGADIITNAVTFNVDTSTSNGIAMQIQIAWFWEHGYSATTSTSWSIWVNSVLQTNGSTASFTIANSIGFAYNFVGNGTVMRFAVQAVWNGATSAVAMNSSELTCLVLKR